MRASPGTPEWHAERATWSVEYLGSRFCGSHGCPWQPSVDRYEAAAYRAEVRVDPGLNSRRLEDAIDLETDFVP